MSTPTPPPFFISTAALHSLLTHKSLIDHLQITLPDHRTTTQSPLRHAHTTSTSSSLLIMPSWSTNTQSFPYTGVKLVTHFPGNSTVNLPGVHAIYVLFSSINGQPLATIDATEMTNYRTACVSALASKYLSREDAETMVMVGAGSLAPHLIKAHLTTRPSLKRVVIWNRTIEKANHLVSQLNESSNGEIRYESNASLREAIQSGDIISCATNSETPLVLGADLKFGSHLDLVGSFTPSMRECDDEALRRGRVFIDNEAAAVEAGELVGAFERGVMRSDGIAGDLVGLIKGDKCGRVDSEEITVFKSVGSAVVDLLSAQMVYQTYMENREV